MVSLNCIPTKCSYSFSIAIAHQFSIHHQCRIGLINRDLICSLLFVPVCCVGNVDFIQLQNQQKGVSKNGQVYGGLLCGLRFETAPHPQQLYLLSYLLEFHALYRLQGWAGGPVSSQGPGTVFGELLGNRRKKKLAAESLNLEQVLVQGLVGNKKLTKQQTRYIFLIQMLGLNFKTGAYF